MKIPLLDKNDSWTEMKDKLAEEFMELRIEINKKEEGIGRNKKIADEVLDVIQVCIGMLYKLAKEGLNIKKAIRRHLGKLIYRGWKFKKILEIEDLSKKTNKHEKLKFDFDVIDRELGRLEYKEKELKKNIEELENQKNELLETLQYSIYVEDCEAIEEVLRKYKVIK